MLTWGYLNTQTEQNVIECLQLGIQSNNFSRNSVMYYVSLYTLLPNSGLRLKIHPA